MVIGSHVLKGQGLHCLPAGLDSLLDKDWRGRGFDQDIDQLIALIQSDKGTRNHTQVCLSTCLPTCL